MEALKLAFRLGEAGIGGRTRRIASLRARLDSLSERLDNLGKQCRKALQACPEEDDEVSLKAFAESMCQRGLCQDALLFCRWLHRNGYLDSRFQPTRCVRELHLFSLRQHSAQREDAEARKEATTMVTPMGQQYFHALFMGIKAGKVTYYPAQHLSQSGNREEFNIPSTRLGNVICLFHLVWGRVEGRLQACILTEGLSYPGFQPATGKEVYEDEA